MDVDIENLRRWIGRVEARQDVIEAVRIDALAATLDRDDAPARAGDEIPPLAHWLFCRTFVPMAGLGPDGHPRRGDFLPPVPLPRRMWAGSRVWFHRPLRVGDALTRLSRVVAVELKQGRVGPLVFVTVRHELSDAAGLAVSDEQDLVYRRNPAPGEAGPPPQPAPEDAVWRREIAPDAVLLFRYSALTWNGHRIHYDRSYATEVEGYHGLVVHGPLAATLLLDLLRRQLPSARVASFSFRGIRPLVDIAPFTLCGRPAADGRSVRLWAQNADDALTLDATAVLA